MRDLSLTASHNYPLTYVQVLGFEEVNVMIIEDVWFELKDGRKALLRSPKEEDIEKLCVLF